MLQINWFLFACTTLWAAFRLFCLLINIRKAISEAQIFILRLYLAPSVMIPSECRKTRMMRLSFGDSTIHLAVLKQYRIAKEDRRTDGVTSGDSTYRAMHSALRWWVPWLMVSDDCRYGVFVQFKEGKLDCSCPERCLYVSVEAPLCHLHLYSYLSVAVVKVGFMRWRSFGDFKRLVVASNDTGGVKKKTEKAES